MQMVTPQITPEILNLIAEVDEFEGGKLVAGCDTGPLRVPH